MAVPVSFGMQDFESIPHEEKRDMQQMVDNAFETVKLQVTLESIGRHLSTKYERHNQRALSKRMRRIHEARFPKTQLNNNHAVVGPDAALRVSLISKIRAATAEEKALVVAQEQQGLHVRPETADVVLEFLKKLKGGDPPMCQVAQLPSLLDSPPSDLICNLTLLSFAKCCVELGALAIAED